MSITVTNKTLIPDLQFWFRKHVIDLTINRKIVPPPTEISEMFIITCNRFKGSFIELLFNDNYAENFYRYRYVEESKGLWPAVATRRLQIYPGSKYLVQNEQGTDIFSITAEEKILLDCLLAYRLYDSTGVQVIETQTGPTSFDATSRILVCNYSTLKSTLSKLIFLYLNLKVNKKIDKYDTTELISDGGLLTSCYELYVLNEYFKFLTAREVIFDNT